MYTQIKGFETEVNLEGGGNKQVSFTDKF